MFEAELDRRRLKVFAKAFACLHKIGTEVIIETTAERLILRTLGVSQSAYAHFSFFRPFFTSFGHRPAAQLYKCKLNLKACLAGMKGLANVDRFIIRLTAVLAPGALAALDGGAAGADPAAPAQAAAAGEASQKSAADREPQDTDHKLTFEAVTKDGIRRTHRFNYEEQLNILQADSSRQVPGHIISKAKFLNRCLANFHVGLDEITFTANSRQLQIKSYVESPEAAGPKRGKKEDLHDLKAALQTEYVIDAAEFDQYIVEDPVPIADNASVPTDIKSMDESKKRMMTGNSVPAGLTFCLKEFKAILQFCESSDYPLHIYFESAGKPILLTNSPDGLTAGSPAVVAADGKERTGAGGVTGCVAEIVIATLQDSVADDGAASGATSSASAPPGASSSSQSQPNGLAAAGPRPVQGSQPRAATGSVGPSPSPPAAPPGMSAAAAAAAAAFPPPQPSPSQQSVAPGPVAGPAPKPVTSLAALRAGSPAAGGSVSPVPPHPIGPPFRTSPALNPRAAAAAAAAPVPAAAAPGPSPVRGAAAPAAPGGGSATSSTPSTAPPSFSQTSTLSFDLHGPKPTQQSAAAAAAAPPAPAAAAAAAYPPPTVPPAAAPSQNGHPPQGFRPPNATVPAPPPLRPSGPVSFRSRQPVQPQGVAPSSSLSQQSRPLAAAAAASGRPLTSLRAELNAQVASGAIAPNPQAPAPGDVAAAARDADAAAVAAASQPTVPPTPPSTGPHRMPPVVGAGAAGAGAVQSVTDDRVDPTPGSPQRGGANKRQRR